MSRRTQLRDRRTRMLHAAIVSGRSPMKTEPVAWVRERASMEVRYADAIREASIWADRSWIFKDGLPLLDGWKRGRRDSWPSLPSLSQWAKAKQNNHMVRCTWMVPPKGNLHIISDFVRPPAEAVLLTGEWLRSVRPGRRRMSVLAAGLGPFLAPSMLSEQPRIQEVINIPVPFSLLRTAPNWAWDATIVHVPDRSQHHVGAALYPLDEEPNSGEVIRKVRNAARSKATVPTDVYLIPFLKAAEAGSSFAGCPLVVIAGWDTYGDVSRLLGEGQLAKPLLVDGIDTTTNPVFLDYEERPWGPRYLPKLTGRLMSLWEWK